MLQRQRQLSQKVSKGFDIYGQTHEWSWEKLMESNNEENKLESHINWLKTGDCGGAKSVTSSVKLFMVQASNGSLTSWTAISDI